MRQNFNMVYLLYEFKRNIKAIILISIILAVGLTVFSVQKKKATENSLQYGSDCVVEISEADTYDFNDMDQSPLLQQLVLSDDTLKAVLMNSDIKDVYKDDIKALRESIFVVGEENGRVLKITTKAGSQDISKILCREVQASGENTLKSQGFNCRLLQDVQELGPISIATELNENNRKETITIISKVSYEPATIASTAKSFILLFVISLLFVYALFCLKYIIEDKLIYSEALEDDGIFALGDYKESELCDSEKTISMINTIKMLSNTGKTLVYSFADNNNTEEVLNCLCNEKIECELLDLDNDMQDCNYSNAQLVTFVALKNKTKNNELLKKVQLFKSAGINNYGVIVID